MTNQELAKAIYGINWSGVQSDNPADGAQLAWCLSQLRKHKTHSEAVVILMAVLEAKTLKLLYPENDSPFKDMDQFKFI